MIQSLSIQNYALINKLEIEFKRGLTIITGETGAGKSILMGALSLILGQRADSSVLKDKSKKCIVEGIFDVKDYVLQDFFRDNDIDYDDHTIIRREININGKSRAFINDIPVNILLLKELGIQLIDIHSQYHNLELSNNLFQLKIVDTFAQHSDLLEVYKKTFEEYQRLSKEYKTIVEQSEQAKTDLDYYQFQYNQLKEAELHPDEQDELEKEIQTLNHTGEIKTNLLNTSCLLSGDGNTILNQLKDASDFINKLVGFFPQSREINKRLESSCIELKDIAEETERLGQDIEHDPQRLDFLNERLDLIYNLQQKHRVGTVKELLEKKDELQNKIEEITSYDFKIENLKKQLGQVNSLLIEHSSQISKNRLKVIPEIEKKVTGLLKQLGIPNARFKIRHSKNADFRLYGQDEVVFLFSANKQADLQNISKVASGGELSRLMLSLKSLITQTEALPTIFFDEIDAGVSGDIADKVGNIIKHMSYNMQVINITHLPQIACKGMFHYLVYKQDIDNTTYTKMKIMDKEERILEIAKMLSGEELTEAALDNARELLGESMKD